MGRRLVATGIRRNLVHIHLNTGNNQHRRLRLYTRLPIAGNGHW